MNVGGGTDSQLLLNPDTLKLTPLMLAVAAQALIKSMHKLLDHPAKSPRRVTEASDNEGTLEHTASFDNEGQMTSPPEDDAEDDVYSLVDPGNPATQVQRELLLLKSGPASGLRMWPM